MGSNSINAFEGKLLEALNILPQMDDTSRNEALRLFAQTAQFFHLQREEQQQQRRRRYEEAQSEFSNDLSVGNLDDDFLSRRPAPEIGTAAPANRLSTDNLFHESDLGNPTDVLAENARLRHLDDEEDVSLMIAQRDELDFDLNLENRSLLTPVRLLEAATGSTLLTPARPSSLTPIRPSSSLSTPARPASSVGTPIPLVWTPTRLSDAAAGLSRVQPISAPVHAVRGLSFSPPPSSVGSEPGENGHDDDVNDLEDSSSWIDTSSKDLLDDEEDLPLELTHESDDDDDHGDAIGDDNHGDCDDDNHDDDNHDGDIDDNDALEGGSDADASYGEGGDVQDVGHQVGVTLDNGSTHGEEEVVSQTLDAGDDVVHNHGEKPSLTAKDKEWDDGDDDDDDDRASKAPRRLSNDECLNEEKRKELAQNASIGKIGGHIQRQLSRSLSSSRLGKPVTRKLGLKWDKEGRLISTELDQEREKDEVDERLSTDNGSRSPSERREDDVADDNHRVVGEKGTDIGDRNELQDDASSSNEPAPAISKPHFVCPVCGVQILSGKTNFNAHLRRHDVAPKPFTCLECGAGFQTKQNMERHQKSRHSMMKPFECDDCGKTFARAETLKTHRKTHGQDKSFICNECGKSFHTNDYLKDHLKMHAGVRDYLCDFCGKGFLRHSHWKVHVKRHVNDKSHACDECDKQFVTKPDLLRHKWVHKRHLPKSEYPFQCLVCDAAFIRPEVLNDHMNFHKGIRPHKCGHCPKTFSDRSALTRHRKQHELKKKREEMVEARTVQLENYKQRSSESGSRSTNILLEAAILSEIDGGGHGRPATSAQDHSRRIPGIEDEVARRSEAASALAKLRDEPSVKTPSSKLLPAKGAESRPTGDSVGIVTLTTDGFRDGWTLIEPENDDDANDETVFRANETIIHARDGTIFQTGDGTIVAVQTVGIVAEDYVVGDGDDDATNAKSSSSRGRGVIIVQSNEERPVTTVVNLTKVASSEVEGTEDETGLFCGAKNIGESPTMERDSESQSRSEKIYKIGRARHDDECDAGKGKGPARTRSVMAKKRKKIEVGEELTIGSGSQETGKSKGRRAIRKKTTTRGTEMPTE